jgi:hypothetical protein
MSSRLVMRDGLAQGGLITPVLFSQYFKVISNPSRNDELSLYSDDTATTSTSRNPKLLDSNLQSCVG